jgi:hypothetical protein
MARGRPCWRKPGTCWSRMSPKRCMTTSARGSAPSDCRVIRRVSSFRLPRPLTPASPLGRSPARPSPGGHHCHRTHGPPWPRPPPPAPGPAAAGRRAGGRRRTQLTGAGVGAEVHPGSQGQAGPSATGGHLPRGGPRRPRRLSGIMRAMLAPSGGTMPRGPGGSDGEEVAHCPAGESVLTPARWLSTPSRARNWWWRLPRAE